MPNKHGINGKKRKRAGSRSNSKTGFFGVTLLGKKYQGKKV